MPSHKRKILYILVLVVHFITSGITWSDENETNYTISKSFALHKLPEDANNIRNFFGYDNKSIFIDAQNHIIVMGSYGFTENEKHKVVLLVLINDGHKWEESVIKKEGFIHYFGVINDGVFEVYEMDYEEEQSRIFHKVFEHKLRGNNLVSLQNEGRQVRNGIIFPAKGGNDVFFMIRTFIEQRYDPLSLLSCFGSGGHGGFVGRPYISKIDNGKITERYDSPVKLKNIVGNEVMNYLGSKVIGDKIHVIWRKYREYGSIFDSHVLQYAYFDCTSKTWFETIEPFGGYKYSGKMMYDRLHASLDGDQENLYCAWYWDVREKKDPTYEHIKEKSIYFNQCRNNRWGQPTKIYSSNRKDGICNPKVVVDKKGDVYVFWEEDYKGLFFKRKASDGWSDTVTVVESKRIRSYDIAVDNHNDFHIIYVLHALIPDKLPYELVYVKLSQALQD